MFRLKHATFILLFLFLVQFSHGQEWPKVYGGDLSTYNRGLLERQEVLETTVAPQNRSVSLNISNLSSGFYVVVYSDEKGKILVEK